MENSEENFTIQVEIDFLSAMCIIGNIQLASRHPKNTGPSRKIAELFARMLQKIVVEKRPDVAELLEKGWNPIFDVD